MYIVNLKYQKSLEEVDLLLKAHIQWLKPHLASGDLIAVGRKNPVTGGIFLVKDMPLSELEELLSTDPFQSVAEYEITKVDIGLAGAGFDNLKGI